MVFRNSVGRDEQNYDNIVVVVVVHMYKETQGTLSIYLVATNLYVNKYKCTSSYYIEKKNDIIFSYEYENCITHWIQTQLSIMRIALVEKRTYFIFILNGFKDTLCIVEGTKYGGLQRSIWRKFQKHLLVNKYV